MDTPLIGITAYVVPARFGPWELESTLVPHDYVRAVEQAGGRALVVPPSLQGLERTLDALDGLIFSGGSDLDPALYGQFPHPSTVGIDAVRDEAELALLTAALERDLPVLAICRGSQVLNVAFGGTLIQHLPDMLAHERHREEPGTFSTHGIETQEGTRLAELIGPKARIKSSHHQGFESLAPNLRIAALDGEGVTEAIEDPTKRFALGVLWHPEVGEDLRLFEALVAEAAAYAAART